jgi:hypothetical protein
MARNVRQLQNMIMAVGPETPASFCWPWTREGGAEEEDQGPPRERLIDTLSDSDNDSANGSDQESVVSSFERPDAQVLNSSPQETQSLEESCFLDGDSTKDEAIEEITERTRRSWRPSIRHKGLIRTVAWLDCPWRLSTVHESSVSSSNAAAAVSSDEYPTQLLSSGDDGLVKFWDVSYAMGGASPLSGGWDTLCPYGECVPADLDQQQDRVAAKWKAYFCDSVDARIPGSVHHLTTIHSGHQGKVFHAAPLHAKPGYILTCGADGFLRLSNLEYAGVQGQQGSTVIVQPRGSSPSHALSHQMLNAHVGLLCSERGLYRFDLRLNPRQQERKSLLSPSPGWRSQACRACVLWTPPWMPRVSQLSNGMVDSTYAFAGGSSAIVHLYDLRMDGGGESRIVQKYHPRGLVADSPVSVNSLGISKNGQELLVSYGRDHIYTFPVYSKARSAAGPTVDELELSPEKLTPPLPGEYLSEIASYGGHMNICSSLNGAAYAGPNDEYICTGSDSGNVWIFERSSATVVSFLAADSCICEGVVPHPSAPVFASYGGDVKLWRATASVNPNADDSSLGRSKVAEEAKWRCSPVTADRYRTQRIGRDFDQNIDGLPWMTPDGVPSAQEVLDPGAPVPPLQVLTALQSLQSVEMP